MSLLFGIEHCKIDPSGRFKFPVALKRQLETSDNLFVVRKSIYAPCLELWTRESFSKEVDDLQKKLNQYNRQDLALYRQLMRCNDVELDNNDRILIPSAQKELLKGKEIVLQAMGRFIEIWDSDAFAAMEAEDVDYAALADARLGSQPTDGTTKE